MDTAINYDERQLAHLVGFELEPPPESPEQRGDREDLEETETFGGDKNHLLPLSANPFLRLAIVGTGTGVVILIAAFLVNNVSGNVNNAEDPKEQGAEAVLQAEVPSPDNSEIGQLKTELAMRLQDQRINEALKEIEAKAKEGASLKPQEKNPVPTATKSIVKPRPSKPLPSVRPVAVQQSPPVRIPTPALPRPVRSVSTPVRSVPRPQFTPPSTSLPAPQQPTKDSIDPMKQWEKARDIGSFGGGNSLPSSPVKEKNQVQLASNAPLPINHVEEARVLSGVSHPAPQHSLTVGATAVAKFVTPIAWAGSSNSGQSRAVLQLTENLGDKNRGLPAGTQLIARIQSNSGSGLVTLAVTSYIKDSQERPLPEGAFSVYSEDDTPLIAELRHLDGGGIDIGTALLSGVSNAAGLINRPNTTSVFSTSGTNVVQSTGDTDILAGVVEGTLGQLAQQLEGQAAQRNNRPVSIWQIPAGTKVKLFVNRGVAL